MSFEQDTSLIPPNFDKEDAEKADDSIFASAISPQSTINFGDDDENPFGEVTTPTKAETNDSANVVTHDRISLSSEPAELNVVEEPESNVATPATPEHKIDVPVTPEYKINVLTIPEYQANSPPKSNYEIDEQPLENSISDEEQPKTLETPSTVFEPQSKFHEEISESIVTSTSVQNQSSSMSSVTQMKSPSTERKPIVPTKEEVRWTASNEKTRKAKSDTVITVSDPAKVGDGMSSYMSYRIVTRTMSPQFKSSETTVNRRFSDFLGLHVKLVHKYLQEGVIIPVPPEKDSISMAKVKISKDDGLPTDFLDRRRSYLERYLNRLAAHPKLIEDSDVREFLEDPRDLPKSSNTQAVSVDGVLRAFSFVGDQVTKIGTKNSEQDQWFEEKIGNLLEIQKRLKNVYTHLSQLYTYRKESAASLRNLSTYLNHLASVEEHGLVANALTELANLEDKIEQVQSERASAEHSALTKLVKEYILILDMVEMSFRTRIRIHQSWLVCEETCAKKRENKVKLEQNPKNANKLPQAEMEIENWNAKVAAAKQSFEQITMALKYEVEVFDDTRFDDFKNAIIQYLNDQIKFDEQVLNIWEKFLPEAQKINV